MSYKNLFILLLKLFALYQLISIVFGVIPSYLSILAYNYDGSPDYSGVAYAVGSVALLTILFVYLANRAEWIIIKLKLDKGFDSESVSFSGLDSLLLVKLGCFIIGGIFSFKIYPIS